MIQYTKSNLLRAEYVIMQVLYGSRSGLQPYTVLKRSKLSGEIFFKVFGSLASKGLVSERESLIYLTQMGREVFLAGSARVLAGLKSWRKIPKEMQGRRIEIDEFYVPNVFLLDS